MKLSKYSRNLSKRAQEVKVTPIKNISPKPFPHIDEQMKQWFPEGDTESTTPESQDPTTEASQAVAKLNELSDYLLENELISSEEYELIQRLYDKL